MLFIEYNFIKKYNYTIFLCYLHARSESKTATTQTTGTMVEYLMRAFFVQQKTWPRKASCVSAHLSVTPVIDIEPITNIKQSINV